MRRQIALDALRSGVGQPIGTSRWFPVTQDMIDTYSGIVEDDQFIHTDPERAAQTPFGTTVAHGFLTLGMLSAMAYDAQPQIAGEAMSVNYGLNHLRFLTPVASNARIRGHFSLAALDERKPGEITTTWDVSVEIDGQPKPALVAEWINRHYLGPKDSTKGPT